MTGQAVEEAAAWMESVTTAAGHCPAPALPWQSHRSLLLLPLAASPVQRLRGQAEKLGAEERSRAFPVAGVPLRLVQVLA